MIGYQRMPAVRIGIGMIFKAPDSRSEPDKVDDALLLLVAPRIVGGDIVGYGSNVARIEHELFERVENSAGDVGVEVSAEN